MVSVLLLDEAGSHKMGGTIESTICSIRDVNSSLDMFGCTVAVGPGERELIRIEDLLKGLCKHEPRSCAKLVAVDDSGGSHDWHALRLRFPNLHVVRSPRGGRGDPWRGGLASNVLLGLRTAFELCDARFVVKLDTDSFVLSPFASRVAQVFRGPNVETIGVVGSCYEFDLHGNKVPPSTWRPNLKKHASLFRLRQNPFPRLETALWGRRRRIREILLQAIRHGWQWGSCAQGGGYAVCRCAFERWSTLGFFEDTLLWVDTDLGEDVVVALLCFASGMTIVDYNQRAEVFGVQYRGLGFSPEDLIERGYGIVHSVKAQSWAEELRIRNRLQQMNSDSAA